MAAGRTSWRDSRMREPSRVWEKKRRRRWGLTFLLLVCVGLFAYLVFPRDVPEPSRTRLFSVVVERTKSPLIPDLPYPARRLPESSKRIEVIASPFTEAASIAQLESSDDPTRVQPASLILFIRAEGVSLNNQPMVLCSDFTGLPETAGGKIEGAVDFSVLLDAVIRQKADLKLIVCDYGRTNIVSDLGLFRNDFAALVETAIKERTNPGDHDLFVLLSHSPLQMSNVQHARSGTVFSNAVADILSNPWEHDPNRPTTGEEGQITLQEFTGTIRRRCAVHCVDPFTQMPILLRGGVGRIDSNAPEADRFLLAAVPPKEPPADPAASPGKSAPDASKKPPEKTARTGDHHGFGRRPMATASLFGGFTTSLTMAQAAADAKTPAQPATVPDAAKTTAPPAETENIPQAPADAAPATPTVETPTPATKAPPPVVVEEETDKPKGDPAIEASSRAWAAYESLLNREDGTHWSPVDFSTHAFRSIGRELCRLDLQLWTTRGTSRQTAQIQALNGIAQRLESLASRVHGTATEANSTSSVTERRTDPLDRLDLDWREFQSRRHELEQQFEKLPGAREIWFRGEDALFRLLQDIDACEAASLTRPSRPQTLDELQSLIAACSSLGWTSWNSAEGIVDAEVKRIAETLARSERHHAALIEMMRLEANALVESLRTANIVDIASGRRAEVLLSSPLLDREQRRKLLTRLTAPAEVPKEREATVPSAASNEPWRMDRAVERAQVRVDLLKMAGGQPIEIPSDLKGFDKAYLTALTDLRNGYTSQPPFTQHYLTLICDLRGVMSPLPVVIVQKPPEPETLDVALAGEEAIYLPRPGDDLEAGWRTVNWTIGRTGESRPPLIVSIESQIPAYVDVEFLDHDREDPLTRTFPRNAELPESVALRVRAKRTVSLWTPESLEVVARSDGNEDRASVAIYRPTENTIRLAFADAGVQRTEGLRIYPSGTTPVTLNLVNETGRTLQMEFDLLKSPEPLPRDGSPQWQTLRTRLADSGTGSLTAAGLAQRVFISAGSFEPGDTEHPLTFALPAPPAPAAPAEGAPPAAPPAADPPPKLDVSNGLICIAREVNAPAGAEAVVQAFRVPIRPLQPAEYLDASAQFDAKAGRITVAVSRKNPANPREMTAKIANADQFTAVSSDGTLKSESTKVYVSAPDDGRTRQIEIDVDGYPRAFLFDVRCLPNQLPVEPNRGVRSIRLRRISMADRPWAFVTEGDNLVRAVPNPFAPKEVVGDPLTDPLVLAGPLPYAALKAPVERPMLVEFSADIPLAEDAQIVVQCTDQPAQIFPSDRRRTFELSLGKKGELQLGCLLSDWSAEISLAGLRNSETTITATLEDVEASAIDRTQTAAIKVRIEDEPPAIDDMVISDAEGRRLIDRLTPMPAVPAFVWVDANDNAASGCGIHSVEFQIYELGREPGKDPPNKGRWSEERRRWMLPLAPWLKDLLPGKRYQVEARARDRLNLVSDPKVVTLAIEAASTPATNTPAAEEKGTISGKVIYGRNGKSGVDVELQQMGKTVDSAESGAGGSFRFTNLKPGAYVLKASGTTGGAFITGELTDVKPILPREAPVNYEITVSKK